MSTQREPAPGPLSQSSGSGEASLHELLEQLPSDLLAPVFTHSSWTARRSDSYERLAFLGDSVLALAVTAHLYPRLEADRFGAGQDGWSLRRPASVSLLTGRGGSPTASWSSAPPEVTV